MNRRQILAGTAATIVAGPALAIGGEHARIYGLWREARAAHEAALSHYQAIEEPYFAALKKGTEARLLKAAVKVANARSNEACGREIDLRDAILDLPAPSWTAVLVKLRVASQYVRDLHLDGSDPIDEFQRALLRLHADAERLAGEPI